MWVEPWTGTCDMELGGPAYGVLPTIESHGGSDVGMASLIFV